ncbi:PQQ-dependent sugar dehydrogenase [uncultured Thermanaerothrix sp.]|uniref:PQQ-dependent sugar dehydrogenase n=1 Tax=uncultured Thermanaerothrix sp. TaxID=1195149 RepID=UPI00260F8F6F|nr:PQQ-dependent sugar dehydrogenase [uncultured Thermanaerothrix sp.]
MRTLILATILLGLLSACVTLSPSPTPPPLHPTSTQPSPTQPFVPPTATTAPTFTLSPSPAQSVPAPDPARLVWRPFIRGLERPVDLADLGNGQLLVLEQVGQVRRVVNGQVQPAPFLDLRDRVGSQGSEQGLLGIALDPEFERNGLFYLNYTDRQGNSVIARYALAPDGQLGDPNSEERLLYVEQPYANHNGGGLVFGPDGYLYIGLGDGGSAGDPQGRAQDPNTLLGKMLRIDVRGAQPYAIPADNPFADGRGGQPEIWALGLRNPWRYAFDSATGDLYIADVGQNRWEEVDYLPAGAPSGANFGWNYREGTHPYKGNPPPGLVLIDPVWEYGHDQGRCSITGGFVYRGQALPELQGVYIFGDYCGGQVWGLWRTPEGAWQALELARTSANISAFGQDRQGELYLLDHRGGVLYRLERP